MNLQDQIGIRGEALFRKVITKWCDDRIWFVDTFLGEKFQAKDYLVTLIDPTCGGDATFYVQVKATTQGYTGSGDSQKLRANVSADDIEDLKGANAPVYVMGVDIINEKAYLVGVTDLTGVLHGIPTTHLIDDCVAIKKLWNEVNDYWKARKMMLPNTQFS